MRVMHPFHPLSGRTFEFVNRRKSWQSDRVYFFDDAGELACLPAEWTDVVPGIRSWWCRRDGRSTPGQARPGPAQVEATGKALGDSHRLGRSYHPDLGGPLPKNVSATRNTRHNSSNTT